MATEAHPLVHEAPQGFVRKYIFSKDHKVIGIQYILLAMVSVVIGMYLSALMRFHLGWIIACGLWRNNTTTAKALR